MVTLAKKVRQARSPGGKFAPVEGQAQFEAYWQRTQAQYLNLVQPFKSSVPPQHWPWSTDAWTVWREKALDHAKQRAVFDWLFGLVVQGQHPSELASGQLDSGSRMGMNGLVIRPPRTALATQTWEAATRLHREVQERRIPLDALVATRLEHATRGYGEDRSVIRLLRVVRGAITDFEAQQAAQVQAVQVLPTLRVLHPFVANGRTWTRGEYRVPAETVTELRHWQELMEAQAHSHEWDAPIGFQADSWPPFSVLESHAAKKTPSASKVGAS